jgi:DnaJ-domain-containing protein 1
MIKRLFNIARTEFNDLTQKNKSADEPLPEPDFFETYQEESNPLARYYANLEIPVGSDRETIKTAWKTQLKKYHPDLHGSDPEKKKIAEELTRKLNEAYRTLVSTFKKSNRRK